MARTVTVSPVGAISTSNATPGAPTTIVGEPPQWTDGSDASYVQLMGIYQADIGIPGSATCSLETGITVPQSPDKTTAVARVRLSSSSGKPLPQVSIKRSNGELLLFGGDTGVAPGGPTWIDIPLTPVGSGMNLLLYYLNNGYEAFTIGLAAPIEFIYPAAVTSYEWKVYEAALILSLPSSDAPPCRIFPRRDGLGIGAGVAFPPPKSQQRSPGRRGVGYY